MKLSNNTIFITAGSSGIELELVTQLTHLGNKIIMVPGTTALSAQFFRKKNPKGRLD